VTSVYERRVRFEDVDAANIVFFGRFFGYCHEAMETLFERELPGGYVALITQRRIGFPAVHVECDFEQPLRYGDIAHITTSVERIGNKSCTFCYAITRGSDGEHVASIRHICAVSDLAALKAIPIPDDVRATLVRHLTTPS
jgi:4-hydroxybenzoyl-CoA thioesterase